MPICEQCGQEKPDAEECEDPYLKEIWDKVVTMVLCDACHQDRRDDI